MSVNGVVIERDGAVLRITWNRPETMNGVTAPILAAAADAVESVADDPAIRVIVLTGAGRGFCSGADLAAGMVEHGGPTPDTLEVANRIVSALRTSPKPVVAAVNGPAAGVGVSLALAADLVVARESAFFLLAFTRIGLMPDGGATALVGAAIGRARAARMALLAERIPAPQALEWGLISHVVPDDSFDEGVAEVVAALVAGPPLAYAETKAALAETSLALLDAALERERAGQTRLLGSADFAEGVAAFLEKRPPGFTGA